jgi:hypothetical protein
MPLGTEVSALLLSVIVAALLSALAALELRVRRADPAARGRVEIAGGDALTTTDEAL